MLICRLLKQLNASASLRERLWLINTCPKVVKGFCAFDQVNLDTYVSRFGSRYALCSILLCPIVLYSQISFISFVFSDNVVSHASLLPALKPAGLMIFGTVGAWEPAPAGCLDDVFSRWTNMDKRSFLFHFLLSFFIGADSPRLVRANCPTHVVVSL